MEIKMKIWELGRDLENYESLAWGEDEFDIDLDFIRSFNGTPKEKEWIPIQLLRMDGEGEFSNTPGLSAHIPVFDVEAVDTLKEYLNGNAEVLPIFCEDKEFYIINVTNVVDCIDYGASEYKTFRDGVKIMRFIKYAFIAKEIENIHIFKIKDQPLGRPFVSDEVRNKVLASKLTGFKFELVWDSEEAV